MEDVVELGRENKGLDVEALQARHKELVDSMYGEEVLDDRFSELQELQDADNPNFVGVTITDYLEECANSIKELDEALKADPVEHHFCSPVRAYGWRIGNLNAAIGAHQVAVWCERFRDCCRREDKQGCLAALEKVKEAFNVLTPRLERILQLERQIVAAGGTLYYMNGH